MFVVVLNTQRMQHNKSRKKYNEKNPHRNLCVLFCFYSFCAALTDGTVCSMRMFIYFRSFWTPYSLFDLQVVHCTTHCNPHCIAIPAYRLWMLVECWSLLLLLFFSYVFVIRSCAISLYFISLPIRLCFFTYLCSFLFSTIDLAFLFD